MERNLFSAEKICKSNCAYCFAKWNNYKSFSKLNVEKINDDYSIIYPNCDGDFFDISFEEQITKLMSLNKKIIVSISTKNNISDFQLKQLSLLDKRLKHTGGFVKISYSFSCTSSISIFEDGTLDFEQRIKTIERIRNTGITYSTIIKPILPFIDFCEYKNLINRTVVFSKNYILGDLYIDETTEFYKKYIKDKYQIVNKTVEWRSPTETWKCVPSDMHNKIKKYIESLSGKCYESDIEYLQNII